MKNSVKALLGCLLAITACWAVAGGCNKNSTTQPAGSPVKVDAAARSVSFPAAAVKQGTYSELAGAVEYVLVAKGGKEYESLFVTEVAPQAIYDALVQLGLPDGQPAEPGLLPRGLPLDVLVEYVASGKTVRRPIDEFLLLLKGGQRVPPTPWTFTGSLLATDPQTNKEIIQATLTQSIIGLHVADGSPLLQNARPACLESNIYSCNAKEFLPGGTQVTIIFQRPASRFTFRRAMVRLTGRVQGVGFREFAQQCAQGLKLAGFARYRPDGSMECLVEGQGAQVGQFLEQLRKGPRPARIEKAVVQDLRPEGDLTSFEIWY